MRVTVVRVDHTVRAAHLDTQATGQVTGQVTGHVTGRVTGETTGEVTCQVTGRATGETTGEVTWRVTGRVTVQLSQVVGYSITGCITNKKTLQSAMRVNDEIGSRHLIPRILIPDQFVFCRQIQSDHRSTSVVDLWWQMPDTLRSEILARVLFQNLSGSQSVENLDVQGVH